MKVIFCLISLFIFQIVSAQFSLDWASSIDLKYIRLASFEVDQDENNYLILNYTPNNGDQLLNHKFYSKYHNETASLVKMDKSGNHLWHRTVLTEADSYSQHVWSSIYFTDIKISPDGENIVVLGNAYGKMKIPIGKDTLILGDIPEKQETNRQHFMLCYSKEGNLKWKTLISKNQAYDSQLDKIGINPKGEVFLICAYNDEISFNGNKVKSQFQNIQSIGLFKFDNKGRFQAELISWKQHSLLHDDLPNHHYLQSIEMKFDAAANLYLHGVYIGNLKLSDEISLSSQDRYIDYKAGFLAKYSPEMDLKWNYKFAGNHGGGSLKSFVFNDQNELYFSGEYSTNVFIYGNDKLTIQSDTPPISHSGASMFYGKLDAKGKLVFVKYHQQEKHYTNCYVSNMWLDKSNKIHITGFYNDSLEFEGIKNVLFGGKKIDTLKTEYNGKILTGLHTSYLYDIYHATFIEDSTVSIESMYELNPLTTGHYNFYIHPILKNQSLYFSTTGSFDFKLNDKSVHQSNKMNISLIKLNIDEHREELVKEVNAEIDTIIAINKVPIFQDSISKINEIIAITPEILVTAFPNPFKSDFTIKIENCPNKFEVSLYNSLGQLISSQLHYAQQSTYSFTISAEQLTRGSYFMAIRANHFSKILKLVKVN